MKIEFITNRAGIYGGLRRLYILAQYFIEEGHEAVINFADKSSCSWFKHQIPENKSITPDIRIVPEVLQEKHPKAKNILYYQAHWDEPVGTYDSVITTSNFLHSELKKEGYEGKIIRYGLNTEIFKPDSAQKIIKSIAYMPRKNKAEADLIKQLMPEYKYIEIDGKTEIETAILLQQSDIFLGLSKIEGQGLSVIEAALCDSLVVGYHGYGGLDWMNDNTYVSACDPQEICIKIKEALEIRKYDNRRKNAIEIIKNMYSMIKEKELWLQIIENL